MAEGRIPTNLRLLCILELVGEAERALNPTAISRELGLPKQSVHRLCKTLLEEGYLVEDSPGRGLRPGRRARGMASGILWESQTHIARRQILTDVARQVSETVNFVVPRSDGMFYQDRVETNWPFRVQLPIGSHVPFHCTASGKTFLAHLPRAAREAMVDGLHLERLTANTHVDRDRLLADLKQIRRRRYALDDEEYVAGMVAIAVPVLDDRGRYCASLAFHGPVQRLSLQTAIDRRQVLWTAAEKLSRALFA